MDFTMFFTSLTSVGICLVYMAAGFLLSKTRKADPSHLKTISAILLYVLTPAMIINSFYNVEFTKETCIAMGEFFLVSLLCQIVFVLIMYLFIRKKMEDGRYRLSMICSIMGNVGFFGLPLVQAMFPGESIVMIYSSIFCVSMNLLAFTLGAFCLTRDKKYISVKTVFLNPTMISLAVGLILYFTGVNVNKFEVPVVTTVLSVLTKTTTPLCMLLLGVRLGKAKFRNLFTRPFVYIACVLKLIVFPLFCYGCVYFIPFFDETFKVALYALAACPSAAVISTLAELYSCEEENAANVVLFATIACVFTIPVLMLLV